MTKKTKQAQEIRRHVGFRTDESYVGKLDDLCRVNQRSRRELLEILIENAWDEWNAFPKTRINP